MRCSLFLALTALIIPAIGVAEAQQSHSDRKVFHLVFFEKGGNLDLSLRDDTLTIDGGRYLKLRCGLNRALSAHDEVESVEIRSTCSFSRQGDRYAVDADSLLANPRSSGDSQTYYQIKFTTVFSVTNDGCKVLNETSRTTAFNLGKPVNGPVHSNTWPCSVQ
jgi:hypothetical protein